MHPMFHLVTKTIKSKISHTPLPNLLPMTSTKKQEVRKKELLGRQTEKRYFRLPPQSSPLQKSSSWQGWTSMTKNEMIILANYVSVLVSISAIQLLSSSPLIESPVIIFPLSLALTQAMASGLNLCLKENNLLRRGANILPLAISGFCTGALSYYSFEYMCMYGDFPNIYGHYVERAETLARFAIGFGSLCAWNMYEVFRPGQKNNIKDLPVLTNKENNIKKNLAYESITQTIYP